MAKVKVDLPISGKKMKVKESFPHGKTNYEKGKVYSFGKGASEKYASKLEEVK